MAYEVEADIDTAGLGRHPVGVLAHRRGVKRVDDGGVHLTAAGANGASESVEGAWVRLARYTLAPAAAKALVTAEPIEPAP
jgi:hypothetical protein